MAAGDALLRIKEQLPHGAWTPALKERGIHPRQARRFIQLRQSTLKSDKLSAMAVCRLPDGQEVGKVRRRYSDQNALVTAYLVVC